MPELTERPATELAALIASGTASSREVVDAHLDRAEALQPRLNAVAWWMADEARAAADEADAARGRGADLGPLHGVPVSIKDQFEVVGTPSTRGLPSRAAHRSTREGPLVTRLRRAGAIPFVKTTVPVMLMQTETHNPLHGRTDNPPEYDEWQETIVPQCGPMARTVADVALGFRVLAEPTDGLLPEPDVPPLPVADPADVTVSNLVVGVCEDDGGLTPSPGLRRAVREAADALADAGATLVAWEPPPADAVYALYATLLGGDGFRHLRRAIGDDPLSPVTRLLTGAGRVPRPAARGLASALEAAGQHGAAATLRNAGMRTTDALFDAVLARRAMLRRLSASLHGPGTPDVVLLPPNALPALRHGAFRDLTWASTTTFLANLTGLPAGVVPVTTVRPGEESDRRPGVDVVERLARRSERGSAGLPLGVQVLAPWWQEARVLAAMAAIEARVDGVPAPPG